ncbi:MAG: DUF1569 domain-containing protein [Planctomycetota bacterium]
MPERRDLQFESWEEVLGDLAALESGYERAGKWELDQTFRHLNDWLTYPMDGFPTPPFFLRLIFGVVRNTVGPGMLRRILADGKMKDGMPTAPDTVYQLDQSAVSASLETLRSNIARFQSHSGTIHPSTIFGSMDKETAERLQFVHFAHHLSWLVPTS